MITERVKIIRTKGRMVRETTIVLRMTTIIKEEIRIIPLRVTKTVDIKDKRLLLFLTIKIRMMTDQRTIYTHLLMAITRITDNNTFANQAER